MVGTIEGLIDVDNAAIDPNAMYPLTTKQLQDSIKVNQYQMQAIIHCLDLKNKPKRHTEIKQGAKSNPIHKYSTSVVEVVNKIMAQKGRDTFLKECENIYREHKLNNRKK